VAGQVRPQKSQTKPTRFRIKMPFLGVMPDQAEGALGVLDREVKGSASSRVVSCISTTLR